MTAVTVWMVPFIFPVSMVATAKTPPIEEIWPNQKNILGMLTF